MLTMVFALDENALHVMVSAEARLEAGLMPC